MANKNSKKEENKKAIEKKEEERLDESKEVSEEKKNEDNKERLNEKKEIDETKKEDKEKSLQQEENKKNEEKKEIIKKDVAKARGLSLRASTKYSKYICRMIKGKKVDEAIKMLEEVIEKKRAVKMYGLEIPHRKGMMSGRYPVNTSKEIIKVLKQLKANASQCGIENPVITVAIPNKASRPYRRGGTRGKRTHIYFEAKEQREESK
ncbi:MAG: uL22 family ribosomal protein [Candidatus Pacearchaeota archaeon]